MAPGSLLLADRSRDARIAAVITAAVFCVLYWQPGITLPRDWWNEPDASHGLLLAPIALLLAWRRGVVDVMRPQPLLGAAVLIFAIMLRIAGGLAAELFTMRFSMLLAIVGLVLFFAGARQIKHWWLPFTLLFLALPIPAVLLSTIALPLQFQASRIGAFLLEARYVPVAVNGNVIHVPGKSLFVTEACSGLRSLTALISLALLFGGLFLRSGWLRAALLIVALPVAVLLNGIRIFVTGFLVYFISPSAADGFLHYTEGWLIFVIALGILGCFGWLLSRLEQRAAA